MVAVPQATPHLKDFDDISCRCELPSEACHHGISGPIRILPWPLIGFAVVPLGLTEESTITRHIMTFCAPLAKISLACVQFRNFVKSNAKDISNSWLFGFDQLGIELKDQSGLPSSHKPLAHLSHVLIRSIVCIQHSQKKWRWGRPCRNYYIICC